MADEFTTRRLRYFPPYRQRSVLPVIAEDYEETVRSDYALCSLKYNGPRRLLLHTLTDTRIEPISSRTFVPPPAERISHIDAAVEQRRELLQ